MSILQTIAGTITSEQRETFLAKLASPELRGALRKNPDFRKMAGVVYRAEEADIELEAQRLLPADVAHFSKTEGGFTMKTAHAAAYGVDEVFIPRENADLIPEGVFETLQKEGAAFISRVYENVPDEEGWEKIAEAGTYEVMTSDGTHRGGAFTSDVADLGGRAVDSTLGLIAEDGRLKLASAEPGHIVGRRLAPVDMGRFIQEPRGYGVFAKLAAGRLAQATSPLTVTNKVERGRGEEWITDQGLVKKADGLRKPVQLSEQVYAIPGEWVFLSLAGDTDLMKDAGIAKTAASVASVRMYGSLGRYTFKGRAVTDLDDADRTFVKEAEAFLILGCLGMDPTLIQTKLAEADNIGHVDVPAVRPLVSFTTRRERVKTASAKAAKAIQLRPVDLVKEAAELTGETSVDAVLSLGFLSPDNIMAFVQQVDGLEQVASSLAEMLTSARFGMKEVPEAAAERALKGLEGVIQGLKNLRARTEEAPPEAA